MIGKQPLAALSANRHSYLQIFYKEDVLLKFSQNANENIYAKNICESLFNKFVGLQPATLFQNRLQHMCFPVNFTKLLKHLFREVKRKRGK